MDSKWLRQCWTRKKEINIYLKWNTGRHSTGRMLLGLNLLLYIHRESLRCAVSVQVKIWSPVKEGGPDFTSLLKTMKKNGKERESRGEGALMDSHMQHMHMHMQHMHMQHMQHMQMQHMQHLRRRRRRRRGWWWRRRRRRWGRGFVRGRKWQWCGRRRGRQSSRRLQSVLTSFCSLLFLDASSHLYQRVCPSVRPSVSPSVHLIGGRRGPLDASSQLYKTVYRSIGLSVHRSVRGTSVNINLNKSKPE